MSDKLDPSEKMLLDCVPSSHFTNVVVIQVRHTEETGVIVPEHDIEAMLDDLVEKGYLLKTLRPVYCRKGGTP